MKKRIWKNSSLSHFKFIWTVLFTLSLYCSLSIQVYILLNGKSKINRIFLFLLLIAILSLDSSQTFKFFFFSMTKHKNMHSYIKFSSTVKEKTAHIYSSYNKPLFMFLKVGNIKYCYLITLGLKKKILPLSPAMTTLLFQIQIVKYPFKTVKMVLIRTFNFSLISIFNCQPVCSQPSSEEEEQHCIKALVTPAIGVIWNHPATQTRTGSWTWKKPCRLSVVQRPT